jgi:hypothetical protein
MLHAEGDELVRVGVGERAEQDAIDDAENSRGRTDAERERSDDGKGEERIAAEAA